MKRILNLVIKHHVFLVYKMLRRMIGALRLFFVLGVIPGSRKKAFLGIRPRVVGLKNITLMGRFSFGDHLWLEAISEYRGAGFYPAIEIGDDFSASDFVHIACTNKITIGRHVLVGSKVHITDHAHGIYSGSHQSSPYIAPLERCLPNNGVVIIGDNVWIGDGVVVLPNTTIGSGSVIGANSVVTKDIPENVMAVGVPAKIIKQWNSTTNEWLSVA